MLGILLTVALALGILLTIATKWLNLDGRLDTSLAKLLAWRAKRAVLKPQLGAVNAGTMLDILIAVLIGIILVYKFTPMFETEATTTNITNSTTKSFGDLNTWLIPTLCFLGLLVMASKYLFHMGGKGNKG